MKRFVFVLLLLTPYFLLPTSASSYTSPGKPSGFINDFAGILKPETVSFLNQKLEQFSTDTGNEIVVVTILRLKDETIETYAEKLFQEWGIGKEKGDNGLLLLVSLEDRVVRIEVGYGLEPVITDIESAHIINDILVPAFQDSRYDDGIGSAIEKITNDIKTGEAPETERTSRKLSNEEIFYLILFIIILIINIRHFRKSGRGIFLPIWIDRGGRGGKGGGFGGFGGGMSGGGGASGRW